MKTNQVHFYQILAAVVIMVAIAVALVVHPAAAGVTRVDFENYNIACSIVSQTVWFSDDGVVHVRDRVLNSVVTSTSEYHAGPGHIYGNANITDPLTGIGSYFGTLDIYPTAHPDGYWFGNWTMEITQNGSQGIARLKGYGSLDGMLSFASLTPLTPTELANYKILCGGTQPVAGTYVLGYYLDTKDK